MPKMNDVIKFTNIAFILLLLAFSYLPIFSSTATSKPAPYTNSYTHTHTDSNANANPKFKLFKQIYYKEWTAI
jgi:hypothetical protein